MKPTFIALLALCLPLGCGQEPAVVTKPDVKISGTITTNVLMDLTNVIPVCPIKWETNVFLGPTENK